MRGGKRAGAGRPSVLSESETDRIGRACERAWYALRWTGRRPYYARPFVEFSAAVFYSRELDRLVTPRRIQAAWKYARSLGLGPAQPLSKAYDDARQINTWMIDRVERAMLDAESEALNPLNWLSYGF